MKKCPAGQRALSAVTEPSAYVSVCCEITGAWFHYFLICVTSYWSITNQFNTKNRFVGVCFKMQTADC